MKHFSLYNDGFSTPIKKKIICNDDKNPLLDAPKKNKVKTFFKNIYKKNNNNHCYQYQYQYQ